MAENKGILSEWVDKVQARIEEIRAKFAPKAPGEEKTVLAQIQRTTAEMRSQVRERLQKIPALSESPILSRIGGKEKSVTTTVATVPTETVPAYEVPAVTQTPEQPTPEVGEGLLH